MAEPVLMETLLKSYQRNLLSQIQVDEFQSWGASITDTFKRDIAAHQALEAQYLSQERERRKG